MHCISNKRNLQLVLLCRFLHFFAPLAPIIQLSYGHENLHSAVSLDNPDVLHDPRHRVYMHHHQAKARATLRAQNYSELI